MHSLKLHIPLWIPKAKDIIIIIIIITGPDVVSNCIMGFFLLIIIVKTRYNEPLYNEVLGITNGFLYPSYSKIYEKKPRYNENLPYNEQILPVP